MKKLITTTILIAVILLLTACATSTAGRSPADETWDNVQFWNGGSIIWENNGDGKVTIETREIRNHSFVTAEGTWIQYAVTHKGKTIYILDCDTLTIIYWND